MFRNWLKKNNSEFDVYMDFCGESMIFLEKKLYEYITSLRYETSWTPTSGNEWDL